MLYDTSRPFHRRRESGADGHEHIIAATFPRDAMPLDPRPLVGRRLPADGVVGTLVCDFLTRIGDASEGTVVGGNAGRLLSCAWLDLLTVHVGGLVDPMAARDSAERTLFLRIRAFIETHLDCPDLTPDAVAAAHFISARTLQRLFARHNTTVAAWIRTRRLARCREDLRDPALAHYTVRAIAARWGFTDQAQFSRAFRRRYGTTPRSYRAEAGS